jgi:hypothetical protein
VGLLAQLFVFLHQFLIHEDAATLRLKDVKRVSSAPIEIIAHV